MMFMKESRTIGVFLTPTLSSLEYKLEYSVLLEQFRFQATL